MEQRICDYCNKEYSSYKHLHRHLQICKSKGNVIKQNDELKKELDEMKTSFEKFKKQMIDMMNKKYKMHPKTFQKMVNSNNLSNNNITINNNIKYVEFGRENLNDVFSKTEKLMLLKSEGSIIENILIHTHLNDNYPQFKNIIITNKRNNEIYAYNEELDRFIVYNKNEVLDEIIEYRYDDLILFYEQYKYLLKPKLKETLERTFELKYNTQYREDTCKDFNVLIFNRCDKDNIKYKPVNNNIKYKPVDNIIDD